MKSFVVIKKTNLFAKLLKQYKEVVGYIKSEAKKIKWWSVIIVFLPPIVFAWPLLNDFIPFPFKGYLSLLGSSQYINASSSPQKLTIKGASDSLVGKNLFSSLFKIEAISPMPVELCLHNQNKIFNNNKEVNYNSLSDTEVGAMNIKFHIINNNVPDEIYTKIGETNCKILPTAGIIMDNESEIRNPLPVEAKTSLQGKNIVVKLEQNNNKVKIYRTPAYFHIKWQMSIFLKNFLLLIFAWWVFLNSWFSIKKYIYSNKN